MSEEIFNRFLYFINSKGHNLSTFIKECGFVYSSTHRMFNERRLKWLKAPYFIETKKHFPDFDANQILFGDLNRAIMQNKAAKNTPILHITPSSHATYISSIASDEVDYENGIDLHVEGGVRTAQFDFFNRSPIVKSSESVIAIPVESARDVSEGDTCIFINKLGYDIYIIQEIEDSLMKVINAQGTVLEFFENEILQMWKAIKIIRPISKNKKLPK